MATSNYPNGLSVYGVPVLPGDSQIITGNIWFVSSLTGSSGMNGMTPQTPFASIATAVTAATATNGDTIYVLPGHTEAVIADGTITLSKAGVRVVGLGWGRLRPIITYTTAAAASVNVTAANVRIENIVFNGTGVASVTNMVNLKTAGTDAQFINCDFIHANATNQALNVILTDANSGRALISDCIFHDITGSTAPTAGTASAISIVGGDGITIKRCQFFGDYSATLGIILQATTVTSNLTIEDCEFNNAHGSASKSIVLGSTCTGCIRRCHFQGLSGTAHITGAAMSWVGQNYASATIATIGTLV